LEQKYEVESIRIYAKVEETSQDGASGRLARNIISGLQASTMRGLMY